MEVDFDSLLESISSYLLHDHSEFSLEKDNLVSVPLFCSNELSFPAVSDHNSSVNNHPEMSSIFSASSGSCAEYSLSSGLIDPYFMDEPIDPLLDLNSLEIYSLLNENTNDIFPITNIPSSESDITRTFLPSMDASNIRMSRNQDFLIEGEYNSDDLKNNNAPTFQSLSPDRRKYRGVVKRPREKFTAEMRNPEKKGSRFWLGTYDTPEEAAMAYDRAAFKVRGNHALLNFPHLVNSHNENPEKYVTKKRRTTSTSLSSSSSKGSSKNGQRRRIIMHNINYHA